MIDAAVKFYLRSFKLTLIFYMARVKRTGSFYRFFLFMRDPPSPPMPAVRMTAKRTAQSIYQYYVPEQEERGGVLAIEIRMIEGWHDLCNGRHA